MIVTRRHAYFIRHGHRSFSCNVSLQSGHNRWSKIRHDKAKADFSINKRNNAISLELIRLSKTNGPDPQTNSALAQAIASAKKQGYPKASVESAIARGQGRSSTGAPLENVTVEAILPGGFAIIIECQTESRMHTVNEVRTVINKNGGTVAPTSHMFDRRGRIELQKQSVASYVNVFEWAVEADAEDVEEDENGGHVILCEVTATASCAAALEKKGLRIQSSGIVWTPKEDLMNRDEPTKEAIDLYEKLLDVQGVQDIFVNAELDSLTT